MRKRVGAPAVVGGDAPPGHVGEDTPHDKVPEDLRDSYPAKAYLNERFVRRDLTVGTQVISHNAPPDAPRPRERRYEQARALGGGSSINGRLANRGAPQDYDEWEARGAKVRAGREVLPYFRKIEHDMDVDFPTIMTAEKIADAILAGG